MHYCIVYSFQSRYKNLSIIIFCYSNFICYFIHGFFNYP